MKVFKGKIENCIIKRTAKYKYSFLKFLDF